MKDTRKNRRWAKKLALRIWKYLKENPNISNKEHLPTNLRRETKFLIFRCPTCELYKYATEKECSKCPLAKGVHSCYDSKGEYSRWQEATTPAARLNSATDLYDRIKAWKTG